jgi:2-(1,2-epoxy-1,2-dihydrophenyl)acetyl-CoA isomerase
VIRSQVQDGITVVVLDRPERRNALVPDLARRLAAHLQVAGQTQRPVVLAASGPSFCVGADLKWLGACADPAIGVAKLVAMHHLAVTTLLDMPVPVIAAIDGAVAGGGLGLALAADYRVAARGATFTAAYFRLGLTPDGGSSALLQQTIGRARTLELLLTNRRLSADEAGALGLVNEVVGDGESLPRAIAFARGLEAVPGYTLRQSRNLLDTVNIRNQLQREAVAIRTAARGPRFRAALKSFLAAHEG